MSFAASAVIHCGLETISPEEAVGKSATTQDLQRIKRFLEDVSRALKNHREDALRRMGHEADDHERKMNEIISKVRRHWEE